MAKQKSRSTMISPDQGQTANEVTAPAPASQGYITIQEQEYFDLSHHEDELINHRLTWLIGSQSLLFAGYAVLLTGEKEKIAVMKEQVVAVTKWLPILGITIAVLIFLGILGAVAASCILKSRYNRKTYGVHWVTTILGWAPPLLFPWVFVLTWLKVRP